MNSESIDAVLQRLDGVKSAGGGWTARCPAHDDVCNSLSINHGEGGRVLLHCHAGCATERIVASLGMQMSDLMPKRHAGGTSATYDYRNEAGELLYQVCRLEPKGFRQRRPDTLSPGGWSWSLAGVRRVPYRLPELLAADPAATIFVCEGEKDADRLVRMGLVATTNSGGAGKWRDEFAAHFRGRDVVILPDNDEPGRKHAEQVAGSLSAGARSIRIVELPGLPDKGDVSDWLGADGTAAKLAELVESAAEWRPESASPSIVERPIVELDPADPGPFPSELLKVPGFLGEVAQFSVETAFSPQPVLALAAALPLLGTLTGRKVADPYGTRTNIYTLGVCGSGGGKERAREVNKEVLQQAGLDKLVGPEGFASHAGIVNAVDRNPSILFQFDEIGRLLRTVGDTRSPHLYHVPTVLMKLYTSSRSVYIGDAYADAERNISINQPNACLYGTTVPKSFYDSLSVESVTEGFLSRMLVFESGESYPEPRTPNDAQVPANLVSAAKYWGDFAPGGNLADRNPQPLVVEYVDRAVEVMNDLTQLARRELKAAGGSAYGTLWTRTVEKARKLALLYACSVDATRPIVTEGAALWGAGLSEYLTRHMAFVASQRIAENQQESNLKRVYRIIVEHGRIERSDLTRKTQWLRRSEREEILGTLVEAGKVEVEYVPSTTKAIAVYAATGILQTSIFQAHSSSNEN